MLTRKLLILAVLLFLPSCVTIPNDGYRFPPRTLLVKNRSIDAYVIRYRGVRLGSVYAGRTACLEIKGASATTGLDVLELDMIGQDPFPSLEFNIGLSDGWEIVLANNTRMMRSEFVVPAPACEPKLREE